MRWEIEAALAAWEWGPPALPLSRNGFDTLPIRRRKQASSGCQMSVLTSGSELELYSRVLPSRSNNERPGSATTSRRGRRRVIKPSQCG